MTFRVYDSLRDSGIDWLGAVPSEWKVAPLFTVASECDQPNAGMIERNLLSLSYGKIVRKDINDNEGLLPQSFETYQIVDEGDIVWRLTDLQNDKRSLRTAIAEERGIVTSAYLATRPQAIRPRYLHYLLRAYDHLKVFYSMGAGVRQAMKFADVKRMPVLVPPEGDQEVIENFLDDETTKIDALVEEQRRLVVLLKEKRQAVITSAVTKGLDPSAKMKDSGSEWLGEVPAHWSVVQWRRMISRIEQGWSPECLPRPADSEEWGILKTGCVNGGEYSEHENKALPSNLQPLPEYEVQSGDVLMSRASGSPDLIGSVALVRATKGRIMLSDKIFRLSLKDDYEPEFFVWSAASRSARSQIIVAISGAEGMANNLPQSAIKEFWTAVPPPLEQREISNHLSAVVSHIDRLSAASAVAIRYLQERRASLITAAVTGQIDLRHGTDVQGTAVRDATCSEIVRLCASKPNFGRVKMHKLTYLAETHLGISEIEGDYAREAAGPLDRLLIAAVEQSLKAQGIVEIEQKERGSQVVYKFIGRATEIRQAAEQLLGSRCAALRDFLGKIADLDTQSVEAIATLYAVWNDALIDGETLDDGEIIRRVLEDWHPEKAEKFNSESLSGWLAHMRRNNITPQGWGPRTHMPRLFA